MEEEEQRLASFLAVGSIRNNAAVHTNARQRRVRRTAADMLARCLKNVAFLCIISGAIRLLKER